MENVENYPDVVPDQFLLEGDTLFLNGYLDQTGAHYVAITHQDIEYQRFFWGTLEYIDEIELKLNQATNYNIVYSSVYLKLYLSEDIRVIEG